MPPSDSNSRLLAAELDKRVRPVSEISALSRGNDDEEPTNPRVSFPRDRGIGPRGALPPPIDPAVDGANQLAAIIAAWEDADDSERALLTEFAKRLRRDAKK